MSTASGVLGRAGKTGIAITFVSASERRRLGRVEAFTRKKIQMSTLPTEEDIRVKREASLTGKLLIWLKRGRFTRERELVEQMTAEGYDPLDIAAAALKVARGEEKQRPIHPITIMVESNPHTEKRGYERKPYQDRSGENSHENGMVRLKMKMGRQHGLSPNEIVGLIASRAEIPGHVIGKISIQDSRSYVDIPEEMVPQVLARTRDARIRRQPMELQVA